ncbi:hypothetical protein FQ006_23355 [Escherichia coli]|nr:hypothetical protein [Escherichia coli]EFB1675150.1 hypothetical protein [Escherichia coli]EFF6163540.1 hypothetical protein [Escherichia coli]EFO3733458.1 hypothetical protein [Escherichia coli]MXD51657.1 hypothetical protein [Escherichia coli]
MAPVSGERMDDKILRYMQRVVRNSRKGSLTPTRITGMRRWVWSSSDSGCRNTTSDGLSITICWRAISL